MRTSPIRTRTSQATTSPTSSALPRRSATRGSILAAVTLAAIALGVRAWVLSKDYFYWDDLVFISQSTRAGSIFDLSYLFADHDGHLMPLTYLVVGAINHIAPLNWWGPACVLLFLQLAASAAIFRLLTVVMGIRPAILVPFVFYLFSSLTLPAFAWWAAGINSLPLQAAMAWCTATAIVVWRGRRVRTPIPHETLRVMETIIVFCISLLFFEKALVIPVVVVTVLYVLHIRWVDQSSTSTGHPVHTRPYNPRPLLTSMARLWVPMVLIAAIWGTFFSYRIAATPGAHTFGQTLRLNWHAVNHGVIPAFAGAPLVWDRWIPAPPWAVTSWPEITVGWGIVAAIAICSLVRVRQAGLILMLTALYVCLVNVPVYFNRSSTDTALELATTLRYLPDSAVVITIAFALLLSSPLRASAINLGPGAIFWLRGISAMWCIFIITVSLVGTFNFVSVWQRNPTIAYISNAKRELAAHKDGPPLLDQPVPLQVLEPVVYPNNQISSIFGSLKNRPAFKNYTTKLQVLNDQGHLVPGSVTTSRTIVNGPHPHCGFIVTDQKTTRLTLSGYLFNWNWIVRLSYIANHDGIISLRTAASDRSNKPGNPVTVPVTAGLNTVYVSVVGGGDALLMTPTTAGLSLCIGTGPVGLLHQSGPAS